MVYNGCEVIPVKYIIFIFLALAVAGYFFPVTWDIIDYAWSIFCIVCFLGLMAFHYYNQRTR